MWLLTSDGDAFEGKRLWLRPGKKYLFGRTKAQDGQFVLHDKTISRQHLTIEVHAVEPASYTSTSRRSRVVLRDLNTKIGTKLNQQRLEQGVDVGITCDTNAVEIGRYPHAFRISWLPVAFAFSFSGKEEKADPFSSLYERLGPLDIKILKAYESGTTTHLVARKRNTPKGLQALIDGKHIVDHDTYITAVEQAASTIEDGFPCPLEQDFDAAFPNPARHLPPRGKEPTEATDQMYAPSSRRKDMLEGYTFVFCEKRQFENLLAPITQGRGKALLREIIAHKTTVEDFLRHVKSIAGEKGLGEFEDGSEGKGVVVVKYAPENGAASYQWFVDFITQISVSLDHRLINQNEFLDAILRCDASRLRRPLEVDTGSGQDGAASTQVLRSPQHAGLSTQNASAAATELPRGGAPITTSTTANATRRRARRAIGRRFAGFDDDFDPTPTTLPESMDVDDAAVADNAASRETLFVSQNDDAANAGTGASATTLPTEAQGSTQKRKEPPIDEDDDFERIAPGAAALKRQRIARGEAATISFDSNRNQENEVTPKLTTKKAPRKEMDVIAAARAQREAADAKAADEREALQTSLEGVDILSLRNLAVIEEIVVEARQGRRRDTAHGEHSDRWDDRWNGRKNFKKFRHRGMQGGVPRPRVIVPLEVVKKDGFGIGEHYWDDHRGRGRESEDARGERSQTLRRGESDGHQRSQAAAVPAKMSGSRGDTHTESLFVSQDTSQQVITLSSDDDLYEDGGSLPSVPTRRRPSGTTRNAFSSNTATTSTDHSSRPVRSQNTMHSQTQQQQHQQQSHRSTAAADASTSTSTATTRTQSSAKRPAQSTLTKTGAVKKPRVTSRRGRLGEGGGGVDVDDDDDDVDDDDDDDDDDSEDELRFRFRKR